MIDTSASMEGEAMNAALGLGCRIGENSLLGKQVLTFDTTPKWIDLSATKTLTEMIDGIRSNTMWGLNTNIISAMQLILDECIKQNITQEIMSELTLVILSDMGFDSADKNSDSVHDCIKKMFNDAGLKSIHKTPWPAPHIIYWNLRSDNNSPHLLTMQNMSL